MLPPSHPTSSDQVLPSCATVGYIGTDRCGSVFIGAYEYDTASDVSRVSVRMRVPPEGELVTGFAAGADGAMIDIIAAIQLAATSVKATVDVAGRPVVVSLTYIGPLPN